MSSWQRAVTPRSRRLPAVSIRTSEAPHRLRELSVRFASPSESEPLSPEAADAFVAAALRPWDGELGDGAGAPVSCEKVIASARAGEGPHTAALRSAVEASLRFADCEAVDHPVACLLVQASSVGAAPESDAVRAFTSQFKGHNMPSSVTRGAADPLLLRHHVVLHDAATPPHLAEEVRAAVAAAFGASSVSVLVINSRSASGGATPPVPDVWSPARAARGSAPSTSGPLGGALSAADTQRCAAFVSDFVVSLLLPFIESRVVSLSATISATRRGLRNTLRGLWKAKEARPPGGDPSTEGPYPAGSPEMCLRSCADLALCLRDGELASSVLRIAIADFRADRAHTHAGAAMEALAAAAACSPEPGGGWRREVDSALEGAEGAHSAAGRRGARLAVRAALRHAHALPGPGALALVRAATAPGVPPFLVGHLRDAAARALAATRQPRRAALQWLLAGRAHEGGGCAAGAARCAAAAAALLPHAAGWTPGLDAARSAAGRALASGGDAAGAAVWFAGVECGGEEYATQLAFAAGAAGITAPLRLRVPRVDAAAFAVACEAGVVHCGEGAVAVGAPSWAALESPPSAPPLVPPALALAASAPSTNWLEGGSAAAREAAAAEQASLCVACEPVRVSIALTNPLSCSLEVDSPRILATFVAWDAAGGVGRAPSPPTPLVSLPQPLLSLAPSERRVVTCSLLPPGPGTLRVASFAWALRGVEGVVPLSPAAPRRRRDASGTAWIADVPPSRRVLLRVGPQQPRVVVSFVGVPVRPIAAGELLRLTLRLANEGPVPCGRMRVALSSHLARLGGEPGGAPHDPASQPPLSPDCLWDHAASSPLPPPCIGTVVALPEWAAGLPPGGSVDIPLWVHTQADPALCPLLVSVFYAPASAAFARAVGSEGGGGGAGAPLRFRVSRSVLRLDVSPHIAAALSTSPGRGVGEMLARVELRPGGGGGGEGLRLRSVGLLRPHNGDAMAMLTPRCGRDATPGGEAAMVLQITRGGKGKHGEGDERGDRSVCSAPALPLGTPPLPGVGCAAGAIAAFAPDDALLALLWQGEGAIGVTYLQPHAAVHAALPDACPVSAALSGPSRVAARFESGVGVPVELSLCVANSSATESLSLVLSLTQPPASSGWGGAHAAGAGPRVLGACPPFAWTGLTRRSFALPPGQRAQLTLAVLLFSPGVHDLKGWRVDATHADGRVTTHSSTFMLAAQELGAGDTEQTDALT